METSLYEGNYLNSWNTDARGFSKNPRSGTGMSLAEQSLAWANAGLSYLTFKNNRKDSKVWRASTRQNSAFQILNGQNSAITTNANLLARAGLASQLTTGAEYGSAEQIAERDRMFTPVEGNIPGQGGRPLDSLAAQQSLVSAPVATNIGERITQVFGPGQINQQGLATPPQQQQMG